MSVNIIEQTCYGFESTSTFDGEAYKRAAGTRNSQPNTCVDDLFQFGQIDCDSVREACDYQGGLVSIQTILY